MCELGKMPWLHVEGGRLSPESKKAADEVFLSLGGRVFFQAVEPMKVVRNVSLTSSAHSVTHECAAAAHQTKNSSRARSAHAAAGARSAPR